MRVTGNFHICITCHKFPNSSPSEIYLKVIVEGEESD